MTKERVILGENCIYSADCNETGINNNVIVCGTSGSGKTMSVTVPRLIGTTESSLIVTVTKRKVVEQFKDVFKERGYRVLDLDFTDPEHSECVFDPLQMVESDKDIQFLANSLIESQTGGKQLNKEAYWDQSALALLAAEIGLVKKRFPRESFSAVMKIHRNLGIAAKGEGICTLWDGDFDRLKKIYPHCHAVSNWGTFRKLPFKTASCVAGTLDSAIEGVFSEELCKMFDRGGNIDIERIGLEKTVLFVTTSAVNPAVNYFSTLFYGMAFKKLFELAESLPGGRLPLPVHLVCDDFATGGRIADFTNLISIFREKGISVTLLLQSESQLEAMYGAGNATTIINNCDSYVYLGGNDLQTARNISAKMNRPLEDVLYMPVGREIVFRRGSRPVMTSRYRVLEDQVYRQVLEDYEKKEAGKAAESSDWCCL